MAAAGVKTNALQRSLQAITIGSIEATHKRRDEYADAALQEIDQQFQVPISGTATPGEVAAGIIDCEFAAAMIDAYDERQAPFTAPTFTSGFVLTSPEPVILTAAVQRWFVRDEAYYYGARVRVFVWTPPIDWLLRQPAKFAGELHMNFQGYGMPVVDEPDTGAAQG